MFKKRYRIIIALLGASISTFVLLSVLNSYRQDIPMTTVLVADVQIDPYTEIEKGMVNPKNIPVSQLTDQMITGWEQLEYLQSSSVIYPGEVLRKERVSDVRVPLIQFKPNERAMNVPVSMDRLGGWPNKGDYVDVVAYVRGDPANTERGEWSEIILKNIQLTHIFNQFGMSIDEIKENDGTNNPNQRLPAVATLKVTYEQAKILHRMLEIGSIRLITRVREYQIE